MKLRSTFKVAYENSDGTTSTVEFRKPSRNERLKQDVSGSTAGFTDDEFFAKKIVPAITKLEGFTDSEDAPITPENVGQIDDVELIAVLTWAYLKGLGQMKSQENIQKKLTAVA
jgi:hypothetical protein